MREACLRMCCNNVLFFFQFLDGFEEFVNAVGFWIMSAVEVEKVLLAASKLFVLLRSACGVS